MQKFELQNGKLCYYGTRKQNIAISDRLSKKFRDLDLAKG